MRKTTTLITIIVFFLFAMCKKDIKESYDTQAVACGIKNPIKNIVWLNEKYELLKTSADAKNNIIILCSYQGEDVIEIDYSYSSYSRERIYTCDGKELIFDGKQNSYDDYLANRSEIKVLYGSWRRPRK